MKKEPPKYCAGHQLSDPEFEKFRVLIYGQCGIKLPPIKKIMLSCRLSRRLRALGLTSFTNYYDYLQTDEGRTRELQSMIDAVTTNKTDFFREPSHFEYLRQEGLPELVAKARKRGQRELRLWSSASSTGEEPYTIAMVVNEFLEQHNQDFQFQVLATDICTDVLKKARLGVYKHEDIEPIPLGLRHKYLTRSKDPKSDKVRIAPGLRSRVLFRSLNLVTDRYAVREPMDIIFCRNVLIYFDRQTQEKVIGHLCRHLKPGGVLILGHSETIQKFRVPLQQVKATIYRRVRRLGQVGV